MKADIPSHCLILISIEVVSDFQVADWVSTKKKYRLPIVMGRLVMIVMRHILRRGLDIVYISDSIKLKYGNQINI